MLTLAKVSDADAATNYYENADDYYSEDDLAPSRWAGKGAVLARLAGRVETEAFRRLLSGQMPDGSTMHRGGESSRRAATDLTFSAPKSVSMQALIGGDRRLIEAHEAAVARTLAYIEEHLAFYRITCGDETQSIGSGNLLVAQFRHDLSRSADPQLHSHAVMLNATQRPDGEWRALDLAPMYARQKLLGTYYRAELAREVRALGYGVRLTYDDGRFELAHVNDEQVAAFSNRSSAIEAALAKLGKERESASAREKEIAALDSRQAKQRVDRRELVMNWQERSRALGVDYTPSPATPIAEVQRQESIVRTIAFAVEHLMEREGVATHHDLAKVALGRATGAATLQEIEAALAGWVASGALIERDGLYTTKAAQEAELAILGVESRGREAVAPIIRQNWLAGTEANSLNTGQREAARLILTTSNRVVGVQGKAGTGKTTMLGHVRDECIARGWTCVGLAPSAAAAHELGKAGISARTIAAFTARNGVGVDGKSVVIVDEAGMVSAKDMRAVLEAVKAAGAHAVLVGDTRQLKAVEAGMPFAQLQGSDMATAHMADIQRQSNAKLREAVELAADGRTAASLVLLTPRIAEVSHATDRYAAIAKHYSKLSAHERQTTLVVAGTNRAREAINELVRANLGLRGTGEVVRILVGKDLTGAQRKSSLSYKSGDVVQAQRKYESLGLRAGDLATVVSARGGFVELERADGQIVSWRPALMPHVAAFQVAGRELGIGETVRITANDYRHGVINGEYATVSAIDPATKALTLTMGDGRTITMDTGRPLHIEHGYCATVHSAQGKTCERVIIEADARSATANESLFYVAISRARQEVSIYTDDKTLLPEAMSRRSEKTLALSVDGASRQITPKVELAL